MIENTIICGPAEQVLPTIPTGSINCSISSPPYWALRDYGTATWEGGSPECDHKADSVKNRAADFKKRGIEKGYAAGSNFANYGGRNAASGDFHHICPKCGAKRIDKQLGLEKTFEEYIDKLCTIYDEVKRVLCKDGTCWVNLGDSYSSCSKGSGGTHYPDGTPYKQMTNPGSRYNLIECKASVQDKSLCLIPQRFAIEMVNRGWILRNVIIWHKPNPMPSSAKDRFTVDFEYVYFFVKQKSYFFEPQYEPQSPNCHSKGSKLHPPIEDAGIGHKDWHKYTPAAILPLGRNRRTVWTIPTQSFPDAHFATFPEKLVEPMILSGCPREVCSKCGQGRRKVYEQIKGYVPQYKQKTINQPHNPSLRHTLREQGGDVNFKGYTDCGCGEKFRPGIVLDPFVGRARLARSLPSKDATGSELNLSRSISKWRCAA